jgi:hypothetical protein
MQIDLTPLEVVALLGALERQIPECERYSRKEAEHSQGISDYWSRNAEILRNLVFRIREESENAAFRDFSEVGKAD